MELNSPKIDVWRIFKDQLWSEYWMIEIFSPKKVSKIVRNRVTILENLYKSNRFLGNGLVLPWDPSGWIRLAQGYKDSYHKILNPWNLFSGLETEWFSVLFQKTIGILWRSEYNCKLNFVNRANALGLRH